ncbi:hypothetical protein SFRURICE_019539 [Spodoptera frugiperda]|nr:hypothetical protein SFRURICE_019539 [Spodoptera frugiperda]
MSNVTSFIPEEVGRGTHYGSFDIIKLELKIISQQSNRPLPTSIRQGTKYIIKTESQVEITFAKICLISQIPLSAGEEPAQINRPCFNHSGTPFLGNYGILKNTTYMKHGVWNYVQYMAIGSPLLHETYNINDSVVLLRIFRKTDKSPPILRPIRQSNPRLLARQSQLQPLSQRQP